MESARANKDCGNPIQGSLEFLSFIGVTVQIVISIVNIINNNNNNDNNNNNNNNDNNDNDNIFTITITNTKRVRAISVSDLLLDELLIKIHSKTMAIQRMKYILF